MKKRVLRKISFTSCLSLCCLIIFGLEAQAQVNKFKSRSRFNTPKATSPQKSGSYSDDENNKSAFGNRTEEIPAPPGSKFVNLNPETAFGPEIVTGFDFPDSDIMEVTKFMQELTGINLILDKDVKGKVSITAPTPITVGDAWKAYLAALNMAGYTLVKAGAFYKIINARDVRYVPTKIYTGAYTPEIESHIMKVMALKFVDASEISRNFRPFMSRYGRIIDLKQTNTIIISDTGANIARLVKLIKFIDVPGHEESLQIIKVKNSSAIEIAKLLDEILRSSGSSSSSSSKRSKRFSKRSSGGGGSQNISKIIAEPRTNSIIAMANADGAEELRNLIKKLDVRFSSTNSDKIHVHYLNYGNAEELSKTLSALVSGARSGNNARTAGSSRGFVSRSGNDGSTLFNGEVKITADKDNNAIVVTASATDWITIKNVINKLDIPRDQVYVEGLILETSASRIREFGVEYLGAYGSGAAQRAGFTNSGTLAGVLAGAPPSGGVFVSGTAGASGTVTVGGNEITANPFNAMIKAVASDGQTNVLATPQLLALDNTEAEFEVGETVPVRQLTTAPNGQTTAQPINQEAKLVLKITPQINKVTRFVKLKINQQINEFVGELSTDGTGNATTTRSAVTEVIVRDKDTVVMGGLLRDKETISFDKVPLLGDIPVLGWLFKRKARKIDKVNLLMFMTPTILSPYSKTASKNTLRTLDNRIENLENILDDENTEPFKKQIQKLKKKVIKQTKGPLYDDSINQYRETNEDTDGINQGSSEPFQSFDLNRESTTPDYQQAAKDIKAIQAGETVLPEGTPSKTAPVEMNETPANTEE